jgi:hypothetical protein
MEVRPASEGFADLLRRSRAASRGGRIGRRDRTSAPCLSRRRDAADGKDLALQDRHAVSVADERQGCAPASADPARIASPPSVPVALRALVHALPAAVELARSAAGETVSLFFGRSLGIELRASPAGVELLLRSDARLARASAAELPSIVAALRGRGVRVVRAEVRPSLLPGAPSLRGDRVPAR